MPRIEIISEKPLTLAEVKSKISEIKKRDGELNPRAMKTYEYVEAFGKKKKVDELRKKIEGLDISRLRDRHITKIIDIHPRDIESLKMILTGENITLKQENIERIVDIMKS